MSDHRQQLQESDLQNLVSIQKNILIMNHEKNECKYSIQFSDNQTPIKCYFGLCKPITENDPEKIYSSDNQTPIKCYFGLCKPITENDPEKIYSVIPYMAPETLSRGE
ncbi:hypothetical protein Glove_109g257 [Diversispora epigaea]|uniref:Uncharacterized protein n=1 Tax=Diversispora epigaea TaxID=1348612 RepID=A0A397J287_9GLOM|nr:hypothetical protein Glove_109g257 [Diversispora epigaea]